MMKTQLLGVQHLAMNLQDFFQVLLPLAAVYLVSQDRMSQIREVNADLMGPPRLRSDGQQAQGAIRMQVALQNPVAGDGRSGSSRSR